MGKVNREGYLKGMWGATGPTAQPPPQPTLSGQAMTTAAPGAQLPPPPGLDEP